MAFTSEHYIAFDGHWLPDKYIAEGGFTAKVRRVAKSTWKDGNGVEKTRFYPNAQLIATFTTPMLADTDIDTLMALINSNMNADRECSVTAYCKDTDSYVTQLCRIEDFDLVLNRYSRTGGKIWQPVTITASGLGGAIT